MICSYKNINNKFEEVSRKQYEDILYEDDELESFNITECTREVVLVNREHRQSIIFKEYRCDGEEFLEDTIYIPDYISDEAYNYICFVLNNYDCVTVEWSQVYGTTSDYSIVFDHYITSSKQLDDYIKNNSKNLGGYKYTEFKNNKEQKCDFNKGRN